MFHSSQSTLQHSISFTKILLTSLKLKLTATNKNMELNDENAFDPNGGAISTGKGAESLNDSQTRSSDKTPLKPLNDASRLSGNLKDFTQDKAPYSSPNNCIRKPCPAEGLIERCDNIPAENASINENKLVPKRTSDVAQTPSTTDTTPSLSDMDDLSALLKVLDITNSNEDLQTVNVTSNIKNSSTMWDPLENCNTKEFESVDDEIQFGKHVALTSEPENLSVTEETVKVGDGDDADKYLEQCDDGEISFAFKALERNNEKDGMVTRDSSAEVEDSTSGDFGTEDPFKTHSKILNSPMKTGKDLVETAREIENENPFTTLSRVANSPTVNKDSLAVKNSFAPSDDIVVSPLKSEVQSKIINSPDVSKETDDAVEDVTGGDDEISFSCKVAEHNCEDAFTDNEMLNCAASGEMDLSGHLTEKDDSEISFAKVTCDDGEDKISGDDEGMECTLINSEDNVLLQQTKGNDSSSRTLPMDTDPVPFKTQSKIANSPFALKHDDPVDCISKSKQDNSELVVVRGPNIDNEDPGTSQPDIISSLKNEDAADAPPIDVDPFSTKSKVMNSPIVSRDESVCAPCEDEIKGEMKEDCTPTNDTDSEDPLSTGCKVVNSLPKTQNEEHIAATDMEHPFSTKSKIVNSPTKTQNEEPIAATDMEDPFSTKSKIVNSPAKTQNEEPIAVTDMEDPFLTKSKIVNSPSKAQNEEPIAVTDMGDPFSTKSNIVNSPTKTQNEESIAATDMEDPFSTKSNIVTSPAKIQNEETIAETDMEDPFSTKSKIVNSPSKTQNEESIAVTDMEDPFSTKSNIVNSPAKTQNEEPVAATDMEDPFSTKSNIVTSPAKIQNEETIAETDMEDPFSTKSKIVNSPAKTQNEEPIAVTDMEDPFSTKSKMVNSPSRTQNEESIAATDMEDPFSTKSNIVTSPAKIQNEETIAETDMEDPFSTKSNIVNSPAKTQNEEPVAATDMEDPFSTKSNIVSSPAKIQNEETIAETDMEDPFSTKSKIVNSPSKTQNEESIAVTDMEDQFSTKSNIVNSPAKTQNEEPIAAIDMEDPLSTKTEIVNSPSKAQNEEPSSSTEMEGPFSTKSNIVNSPSRNQNENTDCSTDIGYPFSSKIKIVNSPSKTQTKEPDCSTIECLDIDDPFSSSKNKVLNSPANSQCKDVISADKKIDIENPFSIRNKIGNSPAKSDVENPSKENEDCFLGIVMEIEDPFSTKCKMANSPVRDTRGGSEVNGLSSDLTEDCSSKKMEEDDIKEPVQADPSELNEENAFEAKGQVLNSPAKDTGKNDSQLATATGADCKSQPCDDESSDDEEEFQSFENSPVKNSEEEDLFSVKSPLIDSPRDRKVASDLFQAKNTTTDSCDSKEPSSIDIPDSGMIDNSVASAETTVKPSLNIDDLVMAMKSESLCKGKVGAKDCNQETNSTDNCEESIIKGCKPSDQNKDLPQKLEAEMEIINDATVDNPRPKEKGNRPDGESPDFVFVEPKPMQTNEEKPMITDEQTSGVSEEARGNDMETSEPAAVDDFEDCMFVNAAEAFGSDGIFDKLERDFGTQEMARNLNRGSVLLNFDPLAEKRGSPKRPPRVSEIFKGSSAPSDDGVCLFGTPPKKAPHRRAGLNIRVPGIAKESIEEETPAHEVDMMLNLDTPEMMKGPAVNNFSSTTPRLVDVGAIFTAADFNKMKIDLTLHYEDRLLQKDKDFEKQRKELEEQHANKLAELEERINGLVEEKEKTSSKADSLKTKLHKNKYLFEDYVGLIKKLSEENKMLESKISFLSHECTQAKQDYKTLDNSFDDLFHRYEKMKSTIVHSAENEAALKKSLEQSHEKYKEKVEAMKNMKEKAEAKLSEQEEQIEKLASSNKAEISKMEVVLKRKEMELRSLKDNLERKKAENAELTDLCDSLINKVSGK